MPIRILMVGACLAVVEILAAATLFAADRTLGIRVVSMVVAGHVGGRLAFIGTGFECGFSPVVIAGIVTFHNCTMVLLVYPLCLLLSEPLEQIRMFANLREKARLSQNLRNRWNLLGIALFIWVPLPMTGAVVGALLAHFEGYRPRQVLRVSLGAMIVGVISFTFAFHHLYAWMRGIGSNITTGITLLLVLAPLLLNALRRKKTAPTLSCRAWPSPKL